MDRRRRIHRDASVQETHRALVDPSSIVAGSNRNVLQPEIMLTQRARETVLSSPSPDIRGVLSALNNARSAKMFCRKPMEGKASRQTSSGRGNQYESAYQTDLHMTKPIMGHDAFVRLHRARQSRALPDSGSCIAESPLQTTSLHQTEIHLRLRQEALVSYQTLAIRASEFRQC